MIRKIPYMKRIKRLKKGLACQQEYNTIITKKFLDMPLDYYMKDFPKKYNFLIERLKEYDSNIYNYTYKQTVVLIHDLVKNNKIKEQDKYKIIDYITIPFSAYNYIKEKQYEKNN